MCFKYKLNKMALCILLAALCGVITPFATVTADEMIWMGCGISRKAFMKAVAKVYSQRADVKFRMSGGGATKGIRLTASGQAQIGSSCRHRLLDDDGNFIPEEQNLEMIPVAWDALAFIVHPDNPVDNLSLEQVKKIFTGQIKNWSEVGGYNEPINLLTRRSKVSGVGYLFRLLVMGDEDFSYPDHALIFRSSGPLEKNIEQRMTNGIGVTGISSARKRNVKILALDGKKPNKANIATGAYPLFRPLYVVIRKDAPNATRDFVNFVLSDEGQEIISQQGTVNLREGVNLGVQWQLNKLALHQSGEPAMMSVSSSN